MNNTEAYYLTLTDEQIRKLEMIKKMYPEKCNSRRDAIQILVKFALEQLFPL